MARRIWADGATGHTPLNAARLNQMEDDIEQALSQSGPGLTEDPVNPGTYFMADTSPLIEDPANPGLYTF